jgi:hypothetical protein
MQQQTIAEVTFEQYRKSIRRERVLDEMNRVVPWADLGATIEPVDPKLRGRGVRRSGSNAYCASIVGRSGSICPIRRWKRTKVRYLRLPKNANWLFISCGLANLYLMRRRLLVRT